MIGETKGQSNDRERGISRSAGCKHAASRDVQILYSMHSAILVDDTGSRGVGHTGGSHVVIAAPEVCSPRIAVGQQPIGYTDTAGVETAEFRGESFHQDCHAMPVQVR